MGSAAQTTPCGHIFHMDCLMTWFEQDKSCPLCRSECNASDLLKIHLAENEVHVGEAVLQDQIDTLQYKLQKCVEEKNDEYWRNEQLESFLKEKMEDIKHLKHLNSAVKNTLVKKVTEKNHLWRRYQILEGIIKKKNQEIKNLKLRGEERGGDMRTEDLRGIKKITHYLPPTKSLSENLPEFNDQLGLYF